MSRLPAYYEFGGTYVDVSQVAAVGAPDAKHNIKLTLSSGSAVSIKAKGKTEAQKLHKEIVEGLHFYGSHCTPDSDI